MESKNLLTLAITLTVGIILAGSLLMPVISDATTTEKTLKNTGLGEYVYLTSEDSYSLFWTYEKPTKVTVNGTELDGVSGNELLAMGDFCIRIQTITPAFAQLVLADNVSGVTANATDSNTLTVTYSGGTLTVANNSITKTVETDGFYALVPSDGTHTMKTSTSSAYLKADDPLLVMGVTAIGAQWNTGYLIDGTLTDYTVEQWTGTNSYPATNITDDSASVDGYVDLYTVKEFKWTVDNSGTDVNVTYNYFLVPKEVTAELANHMTPGEIAIMNAIPIMIIVALVVMAAGALYLKRDD